MTEQEKHAREWREIAKGHLAEPVNMMEEIGTAIKKFEKVSMKALRNVECHIVIDDIHFAWDGEKFVAG